MTKSRKYSILIIRKRTIKGCESVAKNLKLKAARAELDYSQEDLAKKVGVSRQTINMIERGDYNPTLKLCLSICHELGKTLDEVFWKEKGEEEE